MTQTAQAEHVPATDIPLSTPGTGSAPTTCGTRRPQKIPQRLNEFNTPLFLHVEESPGERSEERSASWHVLKQGRFLTYFAGSFVSNLGTWLQNTAQMLLAYQLTHSALAVGMVTCAQFSGFLILGPWAGILADRLGSRRVLITTQLVSAAVASTMAYLQFNGTLTERPLMIGALGIGLAFTFALPLQTAMIPSLVSAADTKAEMASAADTKAAMAMNSVSYNAGRTIAPVLCVMILANLGAGWAFALNALSFAVFAATIVAVHPRSATPQARRANRSAGVRVALGRPRILLLLAMVAAVTFADDPVLVLGPTLSHQVLAVSSAWPAYFLSALGLGTVLGALVPTKPSTSRRAAIPLLVLALSVIIFTSGIAASVSLFAALVAGAAALLTGAAAQALLFKSAGPQQAAQVMALWAVAWAGSKPLASLADGWLASHLGVFDAGLSLAAPALILAVLELWPRTERKEMVKVKARTFAHAVAHAHS